MTDPRPGAKLLYLREEELRQGVELLFFAQRDLEAALDAPLAGHRLGQAHFRALYFIGRHPEISMGGLLALLGIRKQSLARVLSDLTEGGLVRQRVGPSDRRQRLLKLTSQGEEVERQLFETVRNRMMEAYRAAGGDAVAGYHAVLSALVREERPRPGGRPAPHRR